jgi:hypothetical protein
MSCTPHKHTVHTQVACTPGMHTVHTVHMKGYQDLIHNMRGLKELCIHTCRAYIPCIHTVHAFRTYCRVYTPCMYIHSGMPIPNLVLVST